MNVGKKTLEFRVGDLLLIRDDIQLCELREAEITAISNDARAILLNGNEWQLINDISRYIVGKIGRVVYKGFWLFKRRIVIRE